MKHHHRKRLARLLLGAAALVLATWYLLPHAFPLPAGLTSTQKSPILLDCHGEALHHLTLPNFTRSKPAPLAEIPAEIIACTLAAEDKRFHSHSGIDLIATARAVKDRIAQGRTISGASTITQQLIKISTPDAPRTLKTKLTEAQLEEVSLIMAQKREVLIPILRGMKPKKKAPSKPAEKPASKKNTKEIDSSKKEPAKTKANE